jgi:glycosyltransferase involved in cell wall biosynthesis
VRVVYVTNGFPWPLTSGYLRHYFLIRELAAASHEVALFSLVGRDVSAEDRAALEACCSSVTVVRADTGSRLRRRLATVAPSVTIDGPATALGRAAAEHAGRWPADAVLFSGKRTFPALGPLAGRPLVTDLCDATSSRLRTGLRHDPPAKVPAHLVEWASVRRVERALVARSSSLLFASARDRDLVLSPGETDRALVVPNGVDLERWRRTTERLGRRTIAFTGAMDYGPNADAALHLLQAVLPRVRAEVPDVRLLLVGRDPGPALREATARTDGATLTGTVPDVRPFLEEASVFAAPLRVGAGIQNKVLEALAMEVPVVASSLAAGGLRTPEGDAPPLVEADGPEATAAALVAALRRADTDPTPAAAGRRFVADHFSWRRSGRLVAEALEAAVGAGRP